MFYSQYILAKRGPLGTIWIAAHLDRRLRKQQITETDVAIAVRACPTSSFLLRARPRRTRAAIPLLPGDSVPT
jgi:cohesin complex subunit SCC1